MRARHPRGIRARLLSTNAVAMLVALVALTVASNAILRRSLDRDATRLVDARAAAGLSTLRTTGDRITVAETPDDSAIDVQVWVFDRFGTVESPTPSSAGLDRRAAALARGPRTSVDVDDTRLHAVPVIRAGKRIGTLVAGVGLNPYRQTASTALAASIVLAAVLFGLVMLASRSILRRALEPVAQMTRAAADWSEHNPDRRFARGEPYDELPEPPPRSTRLSPGSATASATNNASRPRCHTSSAPHSRASTPKSSSHSNASAHPQNNATHSPPSAAAPHR